MLNRSFKKHLGAHILIHHTYIVHMRACTDYVLCTTFIPPQPIRSYSLILLIYIYILYHLLLCLISLFWLVVYASDTKIKIWLIHICTYLHISENYIKLTSVGLAHTRPIAYKNGHPFLCTLARLNYWTQRPFIVCYHFSMRTIFMCSVLCTCMAVNFHPAGANYVSCSRLCLSLPKYNPPPGNQPRATPNHLKAWVTVETCLQIVGYIVVRRLHLKVRDRLFEIAHRFSLCEFVWCFSVHPPCFATVAKSTY